MARTTWSLVPEDLGSVLEPPLSTCVILSRQDRSLLTSDWLAALSILNRSSCRHTARSWCSPSIKWEMPTRDARVQHYRKYGVCRLWRRRYRFLPGKYVKLLTQYFQKALLHDEFITQRLGSAEIIRVLISFPHLQNCGFSVLLVAYLHSTPGWTWALETELIFINKGYKSDVFRD